jgi:hypothetical protein
MMAVYNFFRPFSVMKLAGAAIAYGRFIKFYDIY